MPKVEANRFNRFRVCGKGVRTSRKPGEMNRLEQKYADRLEKQKQRGEIAEWRFDAFKFRLPADKCWIVVDFLVMGLDGAISFHECKGFMEGDAWLKLKMVVQEYWMFDFYVVKVLPQKKGGGFDIRLIE